MIIIFFQFCIDYNLDIIVIKMVKLIETSSVSSTQPILHEWDSLVRKNYNMYQKLIEAKTYQLQRVQRYILVKHYNNLEFAISS